MSNQPSRNVEIKKIIGKKELVTIRKGDNMADVMDKLGAKNVVMPFTAENLKCSKNQHLIKKQ